MNNNDTNNNRNRILLVDDEPDITMAFSLGLEDSGFKVHTCNDPIEALSGFKNGLYDLALIDYKMPNMNGSELYREIRKIDDKVKVCFITAFEVYYEELKKIFQHNEEDVKCFISKPIDIDELIIRIKAELSSQPDQNAAS